MLMEGHQHQVLDAPTYEEEEGDDDMVASPSPRGLNHRGTNSTSSSLPYKTGGVMDHRHRQHTNNNNKLNLYDLLYTGMSSSNNNKNSNTNGPLSPKRTTTNNKNISMIGYTSPIMRRSASHDPQGLRNASWRVDHRQKATLSRSSFPFDRRHHHQATNHSHNVRMMMTTTTSTITTKKQSSPSPHDPAMKLQQGVNEMLAMLQSTTFVGTIDPLFHGHYVHDNDDGEEKVEDENDRMMTDAIRTLPTSMVVLVPNDVSSSSLISLVSSPPQEQQ